MKNEDQKKIIVKGSSLKREFSYAKGTVTLNFTLRIDVKQELKDFKDLLLEGVKDIDTQIKNIDGE